MQKIIKIGTHSLAVIIPAEFIHALGIKSGDEVKVVADKTKGIVSLYFTGFMQLSLPTTDKNKKHGKKS